MNLDIFDFDDFINIDHLISGIELASSILERFSTTILNVKLSLTALVELRSFCCKCVDPDRLVVHQHSGKC